MALQTFNYNFIQNIQAPSLIAALRPAAVGVCRAELAACAQPLWCAAPRGAGGRSCPACVWQPQLEVSGQVEPSELARGLLAVQ